MLHTSDFFSLQGDSALEAEHLHDTIGPFRQRIYPRNDKAFYSICGEILSVANCSTGGDDHASPVAAEAPPLL